jgi:hypothetical protein
MHLSLRSPITICIAPKQVSFLSLDLQIENDLDTTNRKSSACYQLIMKDVKNKNDYASDF